MDQYGGLRSKEQLMGYMKAAIGLETDIQTQIQISNQYNIRKEVLKPQLIKKEARGTPPKFDYSFGYWFQVIVGCVIAFVLWFGTGLLLALDWANPGTQAPGRWMMITSIVCFLPCLWGYILTKVKKKHYNKENEMRRKEYDEYNKDVWKENTEREKEYHQKLKLWTDTDNTNRQILNEKRLATLQILNKLYSQGYIYEKYRNLPALTSMYEYFATGRCDSLIGPHGAYNLYEDEVRKDAIISNLDLVNANLQKIQRNQYMLYQQVTAINQNTNAISVAMQGMYSQLGVLTELTALNTYYNGLTARNTQVSAMYQLMR